VATKRPFIRHSRRSVSRADIKRHSLHFCDRQKGEDGIVIRSEPAITLSSSSSPRPLLRLRSAAEERWFHPSFSHGRTRVSDLGLLSTRRHNELLFPLKTTPPCLAQDINRGETPARTRIKRHYSEREWARVRAVWLNRKLSRGELFIMRFSSRWNAQQSGPSFLLPPSIFRAVSRHENRQRHRDHAHRRICIHRRY